MKTHPELTLAIADAMFYAHATTNGMHSDLELDNRGRAIFEAANRGDEVERKPAVQANAKIVQSFLDALNDYGYTVVALPKGHTVVAVPTGVDA